MREKIRFVAQSAMIAALYVILTYLANLLGIASGVIQVRFSEALTILPYFTAAAIPGLYIGCLLANFLTGAAFWDIIFGSLATLIGAMFTYVLRKKDEKLAPIPPILSNTIIIPPILKIVYGVPDAMPFLYLTVFIGEVISCGILGLIFLYAIQKHKSKVFD